MIRNVLLALFILASTTVAQDGGGMAMAPARFELEMQPGTERTVLVTLDYRAADDSTKPARIVASLNDWNMTREGQVEYFPAGTRPRSAAPWMIYSPGEAAITPGSVHQIRVTITVPATAEPGDHLAALVVEQRPDQLRGASAQRQMIVRYRMASLFYIKVGKLDRRGDIFDLLAQETPSGLLITPHLRNAGNSVVRPTESVNVVDEQGRSVAEMPETEALPLLAGAESAKPRLIEKVLPPGQYTVKYLIDFRDGAPVTEGVRKVIVGTRAQVPSPAAGKKTP